MHKYKYEAFRRFMMAELWKSTLKETHTAKPKPASNKLKEKICFTFKMRYFCNNLIRAKEVIIYSL